MSYYGRRYSKGSYSLKVEIDDTLIQQLNSKFEAGIIRQVYGDWGVKFTQDMIAKLDRGQRFFSNKQADWIKKLAAAGLKPLSNVAAEEVNVAGVVALFERAAKNLKYPKIRLQSASGLPVVLSRAGDRSKTPGWINVTDGGPFGANVYYGKINPENGVWQFPRVEPAADVQAVVFELSEDPVGMAARYGKLTGNCCFCVRGLTDERSLAEGYGPVCAKNFGLPWGNQRRDAAPLEDIPAVSIRKAPVLPAEDEARVRANIAAGKCPDVCCGGDQER